MNTKYMLLEQIGSGSFGNVYKAINRRTKECVAIKTEPIQNSSKLLINETNVYRYLQNTPGFPTVKWFGKDETHYYMVLNLLGDSLETLKMRNGGRLSLNLTLKIGIKVCELLMVLHDKCLIHRDIKPDNFLFGVNNSKIHMVDFGFCKCFMPDNTHIKLGKTSSLIGCVNYASINSHDCFELSRRDDMESLGYMLLYLYLGRLPWQQLENSVAVRETKEQILQDKNIPIVLIYYLRIIRALEFTERPDYLSIIQLFQRDICSS